MDEPRAVCALKFNFLITFYGFPRWQYVLRQNIGGPQELAPLPTNTIRVIIIETFVQAFPPVNIDVFDAAFTPVFVLVVCLGVLACCLCRSVTVIVTT